MEKITTADFRLFPGETSGHSRKPRKKRAKNPRTNDASKPRKPDPAAPKITRPCTECGRKFWSWKALFGHMRCHPDREWRGIVPPPSLRRSTDDDGGASSAVTEEDQEVAACLLMLAGGPALSRSDTCTVDQSEFQCSSCRKVFGSRQALGGHRASHKNVKGCYAISKGGDDASFEGCCSVDYNHTAVHKCGICFRVFASGQALGGHMRCHWEKATRVFDFDLNLAAPFRDEDEDDGDEGSFACSSGVALDLRLGL